MKRELEMLKALADMNRLRVVGALGRERELCACQITALLEVTGATASRHLAVLQHAGLLESRKEGRWVHYRLAPRAEAEPLLAWLEAAWADSEQGRSDAQALDEISSIGREELCRRQRGETCCPE